MFHDPNSDYRPVNPNALPPYNPLQPQPAPDPYAHLQQMPQMGQGAVAVSGDESNQLFDNHAYTTGGGLPHLLELLHGEYRRFLEYEIARRRQLGQQTISLEEAMTTAPFSSFYNFCVKYLTQHRPVENFFVDMNHGLKLSNNARVVVCPGTTVQGTMQDSGAVGVTQGLSQPGMGGVLPGHGIGI